jgi:hypothetical protein
VYQTDIADDKKSVRKNILEVNASGDNSAESPSGAAHCPDSRGSQSHRTVKRLFPQAENTNGRNDLR